MTSAISSPSDQDLLCYTCSTSVEVEAKFCGECGTITEFGSGVYQVFDPEKFNQANEVAPIQASGSVTYDDIAKLESYRLAQRSGMDLDWTPTPTPTNSSGEVIEHNQESAYAPNFAAQSKPQSKGIPESFVREMQSLNAILLRERIFLAIHWSIFLAANLLGFYLAAKCYGGFHGDEVTRFVLALTPLTFINAVALACLAPIRGTRREISRVKERMQYLKVQIEYGNLI